MFDLSGGCDWRNFMRDQNDLFRLTSKAQTATWSWHVRAKILTRSCSILFDLDLDLLTNLLLWSYFCDALVDMWSLYCVKFTSKAHTATWSWFVHAKILPRSCLILADLDLDLILLWSCFCDALVCGLFILWSLPPKLIQQLGLDLFTKKQLAKILCDTCRSWSCSPISCYDLAFVMILWSLYILWSLPPKLTRQLGLDLLNTKSCQDHVRYLLILNLLTSLLLWRVS